MKPIAQQLRKAKFQLDAVDGEFIGWTRGETWNGYACPYFTAETAAQIIAALRDAGSASAFTQSDEGITCDDGYDDEAPTIFMAERFDTEDGPMTLFALGAYSWCWQGELLEAAAIA